VLTECNSLAMKTCDRCQLIGTIFGCWCKHKKGERQPINYAWVNLGQSQNYICIFECKLTSTLDDGISNRDGSLACP
jgi:hypothetical protein